MLKCIYCDNEFETAEREHVLQAFLGARWENPTLICSECQCNFSETVDKSLAEKLQPIRLLLGTEGDHGGTGRPMKKLSVSSGEIVDLGLAWGAKSLKAQDSSRIGG